MSAPLDIVVLGGGPGGYATALRAANHGLRVALVESDAVGGTCLHRGCVPSKALLHLGGIADHVRAAIELGLAVPGPGLDLHLAGMFRDRVVTDLHRGLEGLLRARKIDVVGGWGRVVEPGLVEVTADGGERRTMVSRHVVVATGSRPVELPTLCRDGRRVLSSDDVLRLEMLPDRGAVVGGGAVGVELASLWRSLGSDVVVIEAADRILPAEDPDSSAALTAAFSRRGIDLRMERSVVAAETACDAVQLHLSDGTSLEVDQVLVAVGRHPTTEDIGLAALGVLDDRGYVVADAVGHTAVDGTWAVGDVLPTLALAHAAFAEGFVVADTIAGLEPEPIDHALIPRVTYCTPEVASIGLTEPQARERFPDIQCTSEKVAGNARAVIEGASGHVKLVSRADGTLLGLHVVGPTATELISGAGLAVAWEATVGELAAHMFAHPTISEVVREAALAAAGTPFHSHTR